MLAPPAQPRRLRNRERAPHTALVRGFLRLEARCYQSREQIPVWRTKVPTSSRGVWRCPASSPIEPRPRPTQRHPARLRRRPPEDPALRIVLVVGQIDRTLRLGRQLRPRAPDVPRRRAAPTTGRRPIAVHMLRAGVSVPVVVVAEIPRLTWIDRPTTTPTHRLPLRNLQGNPLPQLPMLVAVGLIRTTLQRRHGLLARRRAIPMPTRLRNEPPPATRPRTRPRVNRHGRTSSRGEK